MTSTLTQDDYGVLTEPATLTLERLLPGPIDRVWSYLTESDLRRQWLASGTMEQKVGAPVDLLWRNDELTDPPGKRPEGMPEDHGMTVEVLEIDAPHLLRLSWGSTGGVTFRLEAKGDDVLLTLIHERVMDREVLYNVSAGWHAHLAVLTAKLRGEPPAPHWDVWSSLREDYIKRFGA